MEDNSESFLSIRFVDSAFAADKEKLETLVALVNDVYAEAESGMWMPGASRTSVEDLRELILRGEIAVAEAGGQSIGSIHVKKISFEVGEFGMLAVAPSHRRSGVGGRLVSFAENSIKKHGGKFMQLELLSPIEWDHPSKALLASWYPRIGYAPIKEVNFEDIYPKGAPQLSTRCKFTLFAKTLS